MATAKNSAAPGQVRKAALRGRLISRQHQLLAQANLLEEWTKQRNASEPGDEADLATDSADAELSLRVLEMRMGEVANLDEALERVRAGTYGRCESCGKRIAAARLKLLPGARHCVDCQKQIEHEQGEESAAPEWDRLSSGGGSGDAPEPRLSQLLSEND